MKEFNSIMGNQIDKLDFLTSTMIKASRLEAGTVKINSNYQNIYDTIALALSGIVLSAENKHITVTIPDQTDISLVHDRKWTAEAIFNILDNAVKYTPIGGQIHINVQQSELTTKIELSDTGKGISKENYPRIFKRFFREDDVHDIEGIGIGLYLTREIITKQKGYVQVTSKVNEGSMFKIVLPNEG